MVTQLTCIPAKEKGGYSDLQVLQSAAGYYVGTTYTNVEADGSTWTEPGSRDTGYFATHEEAEKYLARLMEADPTASTRQHP